MISKMPKTLIDVLKHLYKVADDFPYSLLALVMDQRTLFDFIRVFGGQTLYIPTLKEFTQLVQFCIVEEVGDYDTAVATNKEVLSGFTKARYNRLSERIHQGTGTEEGKEGSSRRHYKKSDKKTDPT